MSVVDEYLYKLIEDKINDSTISEMSSVGTFIDEASQRITVCGLQLLRSKINYDTLPFLRDRKIAKQLLIAFHTSASIRAT